MARPKQIRIGHMTFDIEVNAAEAEASDATALFIEKQRRIVVSDAVAPDKQREDLLHEVLHGCFAAANLDLSLKKEERIVHDLAGPLLAVLRDNPDLYLYLIQE